MSKPQAILFDLDDTIIDRKSSLEKYTRCLADHFASVLQGVQLSLLTSIVIQQDCKGYKPKHVFFADLLEAIPWSTRIELDELSTHWYKWYPKSSVVAEGFDEVMNQLEKLEIAMGVITNGTSKVQNEKIDLIGIRPRMNTIIVSETAGLRKPDKRIFEKALEQTEVLPDRAWFVGDHPVNDIIGSAAAGLKPVWLRGKHMWIDSEPEPKLQINDWKQLLGLLEREGE